MRLASVAHTDRIGVAALISSGRLSLRDDKTVCSCLCWIMLCGPKRGGLSLGKSGVGLGGNHLGG
jgi:hypothetical protein